MEQRVYFSRLKPESRELYLEAHRDPPAELLARYAQAGICEVEVFVAGLNLVVLVRAEDFSRVEKDLTFDATEIQWQKRMSVMKEQDEEEMEVVFHFVR